MFGYENIPIEENQNIINNRTNLNGTDTIDPSTKYTSSYWIGVALAFTFSTTGNGYPV